MMREASKSRAGVCTTNDKKAINVLPQDATVGSSPGGLGPDYGAHESIRYGTVLLRVAHFFEMPLVVVGPDSGRGY